MFSVLLLKLFLSTIIKLRVYFVCVFYEVQRVANLRKLTIYVIAIESCVRKYQFLLNAKPQLLMGWLWSPDVLQSHFYFDTLKIGLNLLLGQSKWLAGWNHNEPNEDN